MTPTQSSLMLVVLTALSLGGLALIVVVGQPSVLAVSLSLADSEGVAPELIPYSPGTQLAERVRYSESFALESTSRVTIRLQGQGTAHVALVSESNGQVRVYEDVVDAPGSVQFGGVGAGEWWLRANASPRSRALEATALVGGPNPTVVWVIALMLSAPLLLQFRKAYTRHHAGA